MQRIKVKARDGSSHEARLLRIDEIDYLAHLSDAELVAGCRAKLAELLGINDPTAEAFDLSALALILEASKKALRVRTSVRGKEYA